MAAGGKGKRKQKRRARKRKSQVGLKLPKDVKFDPERAEALDNFRNSPEGKARSALTKALHKQLKEQQRAKPQRDIFIDSKK